LPLQITWEFVGNVATDGIAKSVTFSLNSYSAAGVWFISFCKKNKNSVMVIEFYLGVMWLA
jgi:hypothetical protein